MASNKFDIDDVEEKLQACQLPKKGNNIITPLSRISFPNLFTPRENKKSTNGKKKYGTSLLIPPSFNIKLLKADAERAAKEKWGEKVPSKLKTPFIDAGDYEYEGYEKGWTLLRVTCIQKPQLFDGLTKLKIVDDDSTDVYPGRWALATVRAFAYDNEGSRGVAFGLNNIKFLHHDEPLGGRARMEDEFDLDEDYASIKDDEASLF